ncbi:Tetratricopeptide repeat protein 1 [Thelohanellus kitauei]|uniref:Tetratricopeptide repeat protein 1 n=1 Tax=Thelohanellus kitauei TaxID=669202 RepID=A0A0C2MFN4_THEKT|nr:Tetratricopeptide repeat protein 1 [Thelohanellus kitauei]
MAPSVAGSGQEEAQSGCQDSEKFESDEVHLLLYEDNSIKIKALKAEGNRYYAACEYDFALNNYMNALELTDESMNHEKAVLQANVGQVYFKMNDHKSAIYHTSKAIDLEPTYLKAILRRANMYELNEDFEHAINDHELALKLDPNLQKSLQIIPVIYHSSLAKHNSQTFALKA